MGLIDIVIINYNSTDYLRSCLKTVYLSLSGLEAAVFVHDNASSRNPAGLREQFSELRFSRSRDNLGFARAVNRVLAQCTAPYVMLLNPDTLVSHDLIRVSLKYLDAHPEIGLLGPRVLNLDGSLQGSARTFPTVLTALFGRNSFISKKWPNNRLTRKNILNTTGLRQEAIQADWISGACLFIRHSILKQLGGLDERFFMFWEDADFCRRAREGGWEVVYYPLATVFHHVGGSNGRGATRTLFEFHKSSYRLFLKYSGPLTRFFAPVFAFLLLSRFCLVVISRHLAARMPLKPTSHSK